MAKVSSTSEIPRRRTLKKAKEYSSRVYNPLELAPEQIAQLEDLADAPIDIVVADHLVQEGKRCLIDRGEGKPHTLIYMPLRGLIEWRSGDREWRVRPGQVVILGAQQPQYAYSLEKVFEVITIHAHIRLAATLPDQPLFKEIVQTLPYPKYWREKLAAAVTLHSHRPHRRTLNDCLRDLLMDLVLHGAEMRPYKRTIDSRVEKAMEIIGRQISDPAVLQQACRAANLCDSHLRALFHRELGISPKQYHCSTRRREAVRLLHQPKLSLKEIAARLGYSNQQHLEKDFKKGFGQAPGKYRQSL